ncbi:collagen alpha-1(X) chain-like [Mizuhopecten yessoensis]|uniref:Complement C1q-like protein 3 n=1 Tax=Mizuhopecten yessoensis TaxID=6573 RepID=A0A210QHD4_MIZYE|nr:collagen alpha-1(X) chain-like [Mizuhopecten yessoensis]OWF48178.1 Complement C1q-like protein 3 [Mizuhopecten yessoensis]
MSLLCVLAICNLLLDASFAVASPSVTGDGTSDTEMRDIRLLLNKYGSQIESLQRENARLEEKTMTLEKKIMTLEEKVTTLEDQTPAFEDKTPMFEEQREPKSDLVNNTKPGPDILGIPDGLAISDGKSQSRKRNPDEAVKKVNPRVDSTTDSIIAFHAILSHTVTDPAAEHIVTFDHIITNIGAHYSSKTGVFTCVEVGVYQFSWMIEVASVQWITTQLVRNGAVIGSAISGDDTYWTTGAASAITMLAPGDEVWVRLATGHSVGADITPTYTMFNGFLIH